VTPHQNEACREDWGPLLIHEVRSTLGKVMGFPRESDFTPLPQSAPVWSAGGDEGRETGWNGTFAPLRNRQFRMYWLGMLAYFMAMNMGGIARSFLAYDLTGKATALGLVSLSWGVPMVLFSIYGGAIADYSDKRRLTLASQVCLFALAFTAAILVHTGIIRIWQIALLAFGEGVVFSFAIPARMAWLPELVEADELMSSMALSNGAMQATRVVGPAVAGGLIALPLFGMRGTFYLVSLCYVIVFICMSRVHSTGISDTGRMPLASRMMAGLRYMSAHNHLMLLLVLALLLVVLGTPFQIMLPVFAGKDVYDVGSVGLGVMATCAGVGATIGAFMVSSWADSLGRGRVQFMAGLGFGIGLLLFGLAGRFYLALPILALLGLTSTSYMVINNTMVFACSEPRFHGRVMAVYMLTWSVMPVVAMPIAALADAVGVQRIVMGLGLVLLLALAAIRLFYRPYGRLDRLETVPTLAGVELPESEA